MPETKVSEPVTTEQPSRRRAGLVVAGAVALVAVGVAGGLALSGRGDDVVPITTADAPTDRPQPVIADAPPAPEGEATAGPGADAESAARGFLTAEATGEFALAYTYLAPDEQDALQTPQLYVAQHADIFGRVTGFELTGIELDGVDQSTATVTATVGFVPTLDVVVGLVPAVATATIPVADTGEGWTVSFTDLTVEPVLPSDEEALADARAYVQGAVDCEPPVRGYSGALQGQPRLIDGLCDATGEVSLGDVGVLDDPLTIQPFLSAFGDAVVTWARVVPVTGPAELRLVLAPFGDDWTVIGAVPPQT